MLKDTQQPCPICRNEPIRPGCKTCGAPTCRAEYKRLKRKEYDARAQEKRVYKGHKANSDRVETRFCLYDKEPFKVLRGSPKVYCCTRCKNAAATEALREKRAAAPVEYVVEPDTLWPTIRPAIYCPDAEYPITSSHPMFNPMGPREVAA